MKIEQLKSRGEFFKKGSIIPQRILKGKRNQKSGFKFGSDTWVFITKKGYVLMSDTKSERPSSAIVIKTRFYQTEKNRGNGLKVKSYHFIGSPYVNNGCNQWFGNATISNEDWLSTVLNAITLANRP